LTEDEVKNEVGARAWDLLSTDEQTHVLASSDSSIALAGMLTFEILWKRFRPTYRLGKLYQAESDRYQEYYKIYCSYAAKVGAGKIDETEISGTTVTVNRVDVFQWRELLV